MNESPKSFLYLSASIAMLAAAGAALWFVMVFSDMRDPGMRSFSVSGEGKVVAIPDVAELSASVLTDGGLDTSAVQKENSEKMNAVITFVKGQGVDEKDMQTANYFINPRYSSPVCSSFGSGVCPPAEIIGYTISHTISVKIRNFGKAPEILKGIVTAGANSVSGLSFTIDDPSAFESEARAKAMADAAKKAMAIAQAGGFGIGRLVSVDESLASPFPYYSAMGMGGGGKESVPAPQIEPGSQEVKVNITARYEIR